MLSNVRHARFVILTKQTHAGYYFNRVWVIFVGCTIWGCMTALFSGCTTTAQGYVLWAINGIGLALVVPTGQSLTADYFPEASRGRAFGALYLTGAFGAMLGAIYATNLGTDRLHTLKQLLKHLLCIVDRHIVIRHTFSPFLKHAF